VTAQAQPERLAGVDYPPEQDLSILGVAAVIAIAGLLIYKWSRGRR